MHTLWMQIPLDADPPDADPPDADRPGADPLDVDWMLGSQSPCEQNY